MNEKHGKKEVLKVEVFVNHLFAKISLSLLHFCHLNHFAFLVVVVVVS